MVKGRSAADEVSDKALLSLLAEVRLGGIPPSPHLYQAYGPSPLSPPLLPRLCTPPPRPPCKLTILHARPFRSILPESSPLPHHNSLTCIKELWCKCCHR